jgi:class 3 adenylate cyclase
MPLRWTVAVLHDVTVATTPAPVADPLVAAREAAARHAWREAHAAYSQVDAGELTPDDLERFGNAAWWRGNLDEAIALRERSYAAFAAKGSKLDASRLALVLSDDHVGRGAFAVAQGWFATSERLLEGLPESPEHARLTAMQGYRSLLVEGDLESALQLFDTAFEIGQRVGDRDTQVLAQVGKARALVQSGKVEEGLALHDETTAAAVCGELEPFATGIAYCATISSCQDVGDYRRAAEWTEEANRWCDRLDVTGFPGICRLHRAEIMRLRGDWPEAEKQAIAACAELHDFDQSVTAGGYYEIGEIRRRRGDFASAEEAYRMADGLGRDPQPGLALLRLAEGKVGNAATAVTRALDEQPKPMKRLRLLPAQVQIAIAAADLGAARAAAAELEEIVDAYKVGDRRTAAFDAIVHFARGQIALAEGGTPLAARLLRRARDEWQGIGAPYETAHARLLLGVAYRRAGDEQAAMAELEPALATFARLGARLDEERAKELLGRLETRRTFLFTDIVDSTKLLETLGEAKWKKLLARHDDLLRGRIEASGGEVIKQTGDGFFAAFDSPKAAVEAAVAIQRALADEVVAPDVRIGAHTGGAFHSGADARDYGGQGVHTAARIGAAAGASEILVSRETLDGVIVTFRVSEPRAQVLKGFAQPVDLVSIDWR